jgi:hypothetical protein
VVAANRDTAAKGLTGEIGMTQQPAGALTLLFDPAAGPLQAGLHAPGALARPHPVPGDTDSVI